MHTRKGINHILQRIVSQVSTYNDNTNNNNSLNYYNSYIIYKGFTNQVPWHSGVPRIFPRSVLRFFSKKYVGTMHNKVRNVFLFVADHGVPWTIILYARLRAVNRDQKKFGKTVICTIFHKTMYHSQHFFFRTGKIIP